MHPYLAEQYASQRDSELRRRAEVARLRSPDRAGRRATPARAGRLRRSLGRHLIRAGGRIVVQGCPTPAPCPWCDLAFPRDHLDSPSPLVEIGGRPRS